MVENMKLKPFVMILIVLSSVIALGCIVEESPTRSSSIPATQSTSSELILKVGETAKTSEKEVTVFSAKRTKSYNYHSTISEENVVDNATVGKIFVLADVEIKNIGSGRVSVHTSSFSVTDSEGYKYEKKIYWGDDNLQFQLIYQNQKSRGKVLFEVPETAQNLKLQYDFDTKRVSWLILMSRCLLG